jgi:hypothetical protein
MSVVPPAVVGALFVAGSATGTPTGLVAPLAEVAASVLLAAPALVAAPAPAVPMDTVVIRLGPDAATVTQRVPALDGAVEAHAIRLEGQDLRLEDAGVAGQPISNPDLGLLPGAYHLQVANNEPVDLTYRVTGRLDRIPLFVSSPAARMASGPVTLRVEPAPESSTAFDLGTSLPRFQRSSEGALIANLSSTPTFVRLDESGRLSFARAADLVVVALILLAAVWAWRAARRSDVLRVAGAGSRPPDEAA